MQTYHGRGNRDAHAAGASKAYRNARKYLSWRIFDEGDPPGEHEGVSIDGPRRGFQDVANRAASTLFESLKTSISSLNRAHEALQHKYRQGYTEGYEKGLDEGYQSGFEDGYEIAIENELCGVMKFAFELEDEGTIVTDVRGKRSTAQECFEFRMTLRFMDTVADNLGPPVELAFQIAPEEVGVNVVKQSEIGDSP